MRLDQIGWPASDPASGRVRLRPFDPSYEAGDLAMVCDLATDPYPPLIGTLPARADEAQARAYLERQRGRYAEGLGFVFAIAERSAAERSLGFAALWLRELAAGRGTIGYAVAPGARGRGVASDAVAALLGFAWTIPGLHRVEAYVEPWNAGSWRACERGGMTREGLLRSHQEIGGARRDMLLYAVVRPGQP
ncbi:MAG: GNAT family N-acetyltransferase [Austwickia sp.]|nr:GNAT family N-acetyltransferase [Actinomycetota bacterium]MCO5310027.1 GNAT family N-acetyltransferase [Austwickia sp.]